MPNKRKLLHNKHKVTVPKDTSREKKPPFCKPCTTTRAAKWRHNALRAPRTEAPASPCPADLLFDPYSSSSMVLASLSHHKQQSLP